jgi:hypothetical protein
MSKRQAAYLLKLKQNLKPVPVSNTGMWFQDKDVVVPSNKITMKGPEGEEDYFKEPIIGIGMQSGKEIVMQPGKEYYFPEDKAVYEKKMQTGGNLKFALDAASFIPGYVGMGASALGMGFNLYEGDYVGAALDAANIVSGGLAKGFKAASQTAKVAGVNRTAKNMADKSKFFSAASNPNIYKTASLVRDYPSPNNYNRPGGYQDNTRLAPIVRPIKPKMQMGGMSIPGINGTVVASSSSLYSKRNKLKSGGKLDNDRQMVSGVASILRRVKDPINRADLANQLTNQFKRENVTYNEKSFLERAKVKKFKSGGQHGGLDRWFAEKWVDVKSGKPCGRQEGESRAYPACRPSKRVSSKTPKTASELSSTEKAKFKATKTSSQRIPYNHKRNK